MGSATMFQWASRAVAEVGSVPAPEPNRIDAEAVTTDSARSSMTSAAMPNLHDGSLILRFIANPFLLACSCITVVVDELLPVSGPLWVDFRYRASLLSWVVSDIGFITK